MGLVIVVILISLGMLFLLKFVVFKPVGEERTTFTRSQMATNTMNVLLLTTTDCRAGADLKISELIQMCVDSNEYCDNNMGVCEFVELQIGEILNSTLLEWKKNYLLTAYLPESPGNSLISVKNQGCPGEKNTHFQPWPRLVSGQIFIRLEVCDS